MKRKTLLCFTLLLMFCICMSTQALAESSLQEIRSRADVMSAEGNIREAWELYRKLALNAGNPQAHMDFTRAVDTLLNLGRISELDDFMEKTVKVHPENPRVLVCVAERYRSIDHGGTIIGGIFKRGVYRRSGRYVNAGPRDRIRALQLLDHAYKGAVSPRQLAEICLTFAGHIRSGEFRHDPRKLQTLSDLTTLPDYQDERHGHTFGPAPLNEDGTPVCFLKPVSLDMAKNDGERWSLLLHRAMSLNPDLASKVWYLLGEFYHDWYGVQTLAGHPSIYREDRGSVMDLENSLFKLSSLGDSETIASTSAGIKRFTLSGDCDFFSFFKNSTLSSEDRFAEKSLDRLAEIYENRRQLEKASAFWREGIKRYGKGNGNFRTRRLAQITGKWGNFQSMEPVSVNKRAKLGLTFRNAREIKLTAHPVLLGKILSDVKSYLSEKPWDLDWEKTDIQNVGRRLINGQQSRYLGKNAASWTEKLSPDPGHFNRRTEITVPDLKPGAYLITGQIPGGNTSRIIIWVNHTVIIKKTLPDRSVFFVMDAESGSPVADVPLNFFGYRPPGFGKAGGKNDRPMEVASFTRNTDSQGRVAIPSGEEYSRYRWIVTHDKQGKGIAYLGYTGLWTGSGKQDRFSAKKAFVTFDRPVYRPSQSVKFKIWARKTGYGEISREDPQGKSYTMVLTGPRGRELVKRSFETDSYGGFSGEWEIPENATLGEYRLSVPGLGTGRFRVEEYRKPDFEVKVKLPGKPVNLGENIKAVVSARYYVGGAVMGGEVSYRIYRKTAGETLFPEGPWDWLYGRGYLFKKREHPGFRHHRPLMPGRFNQDRELVRASREPLGEDGSLTLDIDTSLAGEMFGDRDHIYEIEVEVKDPSRRTVSAAGEVMALSRPFQAHLVTDRGFYRAGDTINARIYASDIKGRNVSAHGELSLYEISYGSKGAVESLVEKWNLTLEPGGSREVLIHAAEAGQYRLVTRLRKEKGPWVSRESMFTVHGTADKNRNFRFSSFELVPGKKEVRPGETLSIGIHTQRPGSTVVLFPRVSGGICSEPVFVYVEGRSAVYNLAVKKSDMPNIFVEAFVVGDGRVESRMVEIRVPPEDRTLEVTVLPGRERVRPGENALVRLKVTAAGEPVLGSAAISVYDASVDYIAGRDTIPDIRAFFWKRLRSHHIRMESSVDRRSYNLTLPGYPVMEPVGVFGHRVFAAGGAALEERGGMMLMDNSVMASPSLKRKSASKSSGKSPDIRREFADTAFWSGNVQLNSRGEALVSFPVPDNLARWRVRSWVMGPDASVGQGESQMVSAKDLMVKLQSPKFFVENDRVTLAATVINPLDREVPVKLSMITDGNHILLAEGMDKDILVPAGGTAVVDWKAAAKASGESKIRVTARSGHAVDGEERTFPVLIHGMEKKIQECGSISGYRGGETITLDIPEQRREGDTELTIKYTGSLAGAAVEALPFLVSYPHGCTEQTLNRFLPLVTVHKGLRLLGYDLEAIGEKGKVTGSPFRGLSGNPVLSGEEVNKMALEGVSRLYKMQMPDGGWGWFYGKGGNSWPHTTATVVGGLVAARSAGIPVDNRMLDRGIAWLEKYLLGEKRKLLNREKDAFPVKSHADNMDALIYKVLADAGRDMREMGDLIYSDRNHLSLLSKSLLAVAFHKQDRASDAAMLKRNVEQFLVKDQESDTAYLEIPESGRWWAWYGDEMETQAWYLKLLTLTEPQGKTARGLVKYIVTGRKHATYWNSTRDTALCIDAVIGFLVASGESKPDMKVSFSLDGKKLKEESVSGKGILTGERKITVTGEKLSTGKHKVRIEKKGKGVIYYSTDLSFFSLEPRIERAGLDLKISRNLYLVKREIVKGQAMGKFGTPTEISRLEETRTPLGRDAMVQSGDLIEVELVVKTNNDYEYLVFEDFLAAGFTPEALRSGYMQAHPGVYMELKNETVDFFIRRLPRGTHAVSYRVRAEVPGTFSALPARGHAMYAPDIAGNSGEHKVVVRD